MNTFFFGYLSLKWRRLVRTLIIIGFAFFSNWNDLQHNWLHQEGSYSHYDYSGFLTLTLGFIFAIALISWVLKPFIVKDKS
jgi:hypothetical protein